VNLNLVFPLSEHFERLSRDRSVLGRRLDGHARTLTDRLG